MKETKQHKSHRNTSGLEGSKYASEYGTTKRQEFYQIGMSRSKKNGELGLLQSYSCLACCSRVSEVCNWPWASMRFNELNHTKSWTALWMQEDGLFSAGFGFGVLKWEEKQNMMMQELGWLSYSVYADAYKMQLKKEKELSLKTSLLDDFMYYENRQKIMQDEKAKLLIRSVESPLFVQALEAPQKLAAGKPPSKYEKNLKIKDDSDNLNQMSISSSEQNIQNFDVPNSKSVNEQAEKVAVHEDISSICLSLPLLYDSAMRFELSLSVWELLFVSHALPLFSLVAGFYATYVHDLLEAAYGPAFRCSRKCWLLSLIAVSHCVGLCFGIVTEFSSTGMCHAAAFISLLHHHKFKAKMHVGMLQWSGHGAAARLGSSVLQDWAGLLQQG
ncbi:hypothetical protein KIW84_055245 [Lathyrus oleraceus]|uniref:Uncharacterized protein n=1 Tax=Pisum sativum TaxID=3888 RepID=A0A9D5AIE2_PEA|nr:hypothetical protein KIW84_055245 [Pisum sativum]